MKTPPDHSAIYHTAPLEDPSKQIRLLRCTSRNKASNLRYEFIVRSLPPARPEVDVSGRDSDPGDPLSNDDPTLRYDAISYTWGDPDKRRFIQVNNIPVDVTANCYEALSQARKHGSRLTWVDSVCINQQDLAEKGSQVAIMWDVYRSADRVLVCTGTPDEASQRIGPVLLNLEEHIASYPPAEEVITISTYILSPPKGKGGDSDGGNFRDVRRPLRSWALSKGSKFCAALCEDFDRFCERPYFSRLWVAQELRAGGPRAFLMFGTGMARCQLLEPLFYALIGAFVSEPYGEEKALFEGSIAPNDDILDIISFMSPWSPQIESSGSLWHLEYTNTLRCQDVRDRVFGTLHFVDWAWLGLPPLQPDYTKSACELAVSFGTMTRIACGRLADLVRVLELTAYDPLLASLLASHDDDFQQSQADVPTLRDLGMKYLCRLDKVEEIQARPAIQGIIAMADNRRYRRALQCSAFGDASAPGWGPDEIYSDTRDQPDLPPLTHHCVRMLANEAIAKGYGWDEVHLTREYISVIVPRASRTGDFVVEFHHGQVRAGLVVRTDRNSHKVSIVGRAGLRPEPNGYRRKDPRSGLPWAMASVPISATVEELIGFFAPHSGGPVHFGMELAPLAFKVPKVVSFATADTNEELDSGKAVEYTVVPLEQMPAPEESTKENVPDIESGI